MKLRSGTITNFDDNDNFCISFNKTLKEYTAEINNDVFPNLIQRQMYKLCILHKATNYILLGELYNFASNGPKVSMLENRCFNHCKKGTQVSRSNE